MIERTLKDIQAMCLGSNLDEKFYENKIHGVSTDSRTIKKGELFIPLIGDNFDGHKFIPSALARGASGVLAVEGRYEASSNQPIILVKDSLEALQDLARSYINQVNPKVITITGSNGKTSTKDILASLLKTRYKTHKTSGNYNNHIGVPLTILSMPEDTEFAVIEMGISHFGDMKNLSSIARPDAGLITNVSGVHLDDLINVTNVARAKMEFIENMKKPGYFLYLKDDETLNEEAGKLKGDFKVESFGKNKSSDYIISQVKISKEGSSFHLSNINQDFFIPMIGDHQVNNASAAIAMASHFGIGAEDIKLGLENIELTGMRNELVKGDRFTILDDSYKSNPASLKAALDTLYSLDGYSQKVAIIGDMLGLGDEIEFIHRDFGKIIDDKEIDIIIGIGYYSEYIIWEAEDRFGKERLRHFEEKSEPMIKEIKSLIKDGAIVLVKASRPLELDTVVRDLLS